MVHPQGSSPSRYLVSIQCLRAVAALAVVAFHITARLQHRINVGAAGVDVFFVISGFIMWMVTERRVSPGQFMAHRLIRIVPLYWIATLMAAMMVRPDALWLGASLFFVPWRTPHGEIYPLLVQGWTLQYEMFFYLLFAASLRLTRTMQLRVLTGGLLGLVTVSLFGPSQNALVFTYTNPILLEFLSGIWLAVLWRSGWLTPRSGGALLLLGLAGFAAVGWTQWDPQMGPLRPLVWGVPAWLVVAGSLAFEEQWPLRPLSLALGDSSYSTYLFHTYVVDLVMAFPVGLVAAPIALVASAVTGTLIYRGVEAPLIRRLRRKPTVRATPVAA